MGPLISVFLLLSTLCICLSASCTCHAGTIDHDILGTKSSVVRGLIDPSGFSPTKYGCHACTGHHLYLCDALTELSLCCAEIACCIFLINAEYLLSKDARF